MVTSEDTTKVDCKKHGKVSCIRFNHDNLLLKKVCFICFTEKVTEGLEDFREKN